MVVFPNMVVPLFVGRDKSIKALEYAMSHEKEVFLSAQRDAKLDRPGENDIYHSGTLGTVLQLLRLPDGTVKALIEGKQRAKVVGFASNPDFFMVVVERIQDDWEMNDQTRALMRALNESFEEYAKFNEKMGKDLVATVAAIDDPVRLGDTMAAHLIMKVKDKQEVLETVRTSPSGWRSSSTRSGTRSTS